MNDIKMTNLAVECEKDKEHQVYRDSFGALWFPLDERIGDNGYKWFTVFNDGSMGLHKDYKNMGLIPIRVQEIKFQDIIKDNTKNGKD